MRIPRRTAVALVALVALSGAACSAEPGAPVASAAAQTPAAGPPDIDHLAPAPDSVGATPTRFEWSRIEGADSYLVRVWNEADTQVFRQAGIRDTSFSWPADTRLEFGTYFWAVAAFRDDRPIAESGLAAFVVTR
jgi:hypothetical protein